MVEGVVSVALAGLLAVLSLPRVMQVYASQKLDMALNRLEIGLESALQKADKEGTCSLSLSADGWTSRAQSGLPACLNSGVGDLNDGLGLGATPQLRHNFAQELIVYSIDSSPRLSSGGMAVLTARDAQMQRCLVVEPLLGVVRAGRYQGNENDELREDQCSPDPLP